MFGCFTSSRRVVPIASVADQVKTMADLTPEEFKERCERLERHYLLELAQNLFVYWRNGPASGSSTSPERSDPSIHSSHAEHLNSRYDSVLAELEGVSLLYDRAFSEMTSMYERTFDVLQRTMAQQASRDNALVQTSLFHQGMCSAKKQLVSTV